MLTVRQVVRELRRVPRVDIAALRDGTAARVEGRLRHGDGLIAAPLTGRLCAYFRVELRVVASSQSAPAFVLEQRAPFVIEDASGALAVDPGGAEITADPDHLAVADATDDPRSPERRFFQQHYTRRWSIAPRTLVQYTEAVLAGGSQIRVGGTVILEPDPLAPDRGYRDAAGYRVRIADSPSGPFRIVQSP